MHNPDPRFCMRCKKLQENCDQLEFEKMPKFGEYKGVAVLVRCVEFILREER